MDRYASAPPPVPLSCAGYISASESRSYYGNTVSGKDEAIRWSEICGTDCSSAIPRNLINIFHVELVLEQSMDESGFQHIDWVLCAS